MITLHLITPDWPHACAKCRRNKLAVRLPIGDVFTEDPQQFARARNFLHVTSMRAGVEDITVVACDRPPIAFRGWNDRGPRVEIRDGGDPGDCS